MNGYYFNKGKGKNAPALLTIKKNKCYMGIRMGKVFQKAYLIYRGEKEIFGDVGAGLFNAPLRAGLQPTEYGMDGYWKEDITIYTGNNTTLAVNISGVQTENMAVKIIGDDTLYPVRGDIPVEAGVEIQLRIMLNKRAFDYYSQLSNMITMILTLDGVEMYNTFSARFIE